LLFAPAAVAAVPHEPTYCAHFAIFNASLQSPFNFHSCDHSTLSKSVASPNAVVHT